jgi:GNAT superfamily N-acetyltransferase
MSRAEVDLAVAWAAAEGWNPGLHDADAFYATDPSGFLVGLLDGEPIASISAVAYDDSFGFLGFYIVKPEYRGRGYGLRIWQHAIDYLGGRNTGLDGVLDQQSNYEKSGFSLAYRNVRYQGAAPETPATVADGLVSLDQVPFADLLRYDDRLFPVSRPRFLERWLQLPESRGLALLQDGSIAGYGVIRRCHTGFKIGPLFAENADLAEALFTGLVGRADRGAPVFLDPPEANPAARRLAERHGMQPVFETVRMYTQGAPDIDLPRIFGVTTFELG